eukprot:TRINITY_DN1488_c0_g1_i1.p1 TRINITY_DN1488_c0_g1~~TRINITY_DN1488_c0_g1_i1.p1  ORF type:complete len:157 (-),score=68.49 TRINITY_DN1488_c0_g1_i1:236-706(-)
MSLSERFENIKKTKPNVEGGRNKRRDIQFEDTKSRRNDRVEVKRGKFNKNRNEGGAKNKVGKRGGNNKTGGRNDRNGSKGGKNGGKRLRNGGNKNGGGKRGGNKQLSSEQLDKELDTYLMKDKDAATIRLNEDLDDYFKNKDSKKVTTTDDNENSK